MEAAGRWGSRRVKGTQGFASTNQEVGRGEGRKECRSTCGPGTVIWSICTVAPVSGCAVPSSQQRKPESEVK